ERGDREGGCGEGRVRGKAFADARWPRAPLPSRDGGARLPGGGPRNGGRVRAWLWRDPALYDCRDCNADPSRRDELGNCGGVSKHRLKVLVGESVKRCPTATGMESTEVQRLAS